MLPLERVWEIRNRTPTYHQQDAEKDHWIIAPLRSRLGKCLQTHEHVSEPRAPASGPAPLFAPCQASPFVPRWVVAVLAVAIGRSVKF
jgi:hypothetical protein